MGKICTKWAKNRVFEFIGNFNSHQFFLNRSHVQNQLVSPRLTQPFILPMFFKRVPGISGNLVVKSKLPSCSGSVAFRQLNSSIKKGAIKIFFHMCFIFYNKINSGKLQNTSHMRFLHFQETLSLDFLEMKFPKVVLVIIL